MNITWEKALQYLNRLSESGWRRLFFWASVGTMVVALPNAYIIQPLLGEYAPVDFLDRLNGTLTIIAGLAGLRAVEKYTERTAISGAPNV